MKNFLDEDFLLSTDTAKRLYHKYAEHMPILDYHCHISPREIYEDRYFQNITQVWLESDHYKWRLMRSSGVEEEYITGNASDWDKFRKWAKTLEMAIGNPLYHWSHLELKKYFAYSGYLCEDTAEEVWELCNAKLKSGMTARKLVEMSNVAAICTTDDPIDTLEWHKKIKEEQSIQTEVFPAWRPERAMKISEEDYLDYLQGLEQVSRIKIKSFPALIEALRVRMDYFAAHGCKISDHSLDYVMFAPQSEETVTHIFEKRLAGDLISVEEKRQFETAFMLAMGREYHRRNWVMQLHFGVKRNNNQRIFRKLGLDAGVDCIYNQTSSAELAEFLNALDETDELPKTILYSLNDVDNAAIGSIRGCFQDASAAGKLQQGAAWWFHDNKTGIQEQLISQANLGILGNCIGMVTDSRSFLSYTRHEYFRRILCDLIGGWVENGEYPQDEKALEKIVRGISYQNAVRYLQLGR